MNINKKHSKQIKTQSTHTCAKRKLIILIFTACFLALICIAGVVVGLVFGLKPSIIQNSTITQTQSIPTPLNKKTYFNQSEICGLPSVQPSALRKDRIVGGYESIPHSWPFMVSIGYSGPSNTIPHACGGSLISEKYILTAAHCVEEKEIFLLVGLPISNIEKYSSLVKMMRIYVGVHNRTSDINVNTTYYAKRIYSHEFYDSNELTYDIALIELTKQIVETPKIGIVCLDSMVDVNVNESVVVLGWGYLSGRSYKTSDVLMQVTIPVVSQQTCRLSFFPSIQFCAGDVLTTRDSCMS